MAGRSCSNTYLRCSLYIIILHNSPCDFVLQSDQPYNPVLSIFQTSTAEDRCTVLQRSGLRAWIKSIPMRVKTSSLSGGHDSKFGRVARGFKSSLLGLFYCASGAC